MTSMSENRDRPEHAERIATIFRDHNDSLLRFLVGRLGSDQDAKEVAQEAYVRLLQLNKPECVSFLRAFLFKTAANLAIDRVRHRQSIIRRNHLFFDLGCESEPSPETTHCVAEDALTTMDAINELSERCRTAFLLSRIDDLTTFEIAARLGVSDRAVRKYLVRALAHLHARLNGAKLAGEYAHENIKQSNGRRLSASTRTARSGASD
jgi:RNA polymerase sigma factor (sigma-70 family)